MISSLIYTDGEINKFIEDIPGMLDKIKGLWKSLVSAFETLLSKFTSSPAVIMNSEWILAGLIALFLTLLVFLIWKLKSGKKQPAFVRAQSPKEARKLGKQQLKIGNFVRAGELFEQGESYQKAINAYLKGNAITRAAGVYAKKLMSPEKGIQLLLENDLHDPAAVLYEESGNFEEAARHYELARRPQSAAEAYEKAGNYRKAAPLYREAERLAEAARCYGQAGMHSEAGDMYIGLYKQFRGAAKNKEGSKESERIQNIAKKAAMHLRNAGRLKVAAEICMDANLGSAAAELFAQAGEFEKAAEMFIEHKELKKAAEFFHKAGNKKRAAEILALYYQQQGEGMQAVKYMIMAGDYLQAADIYAGKGEYEKAAQLFMKGGDTRTASEMYMAAGKGEQAIKLFEQQGDLQGAIQICQEMGNDQALARLYERTKRFFEAAEIYKQMGEMQKAHELYMKMNADHPNYAQAQAEMGAELMRQGKHQEALEKFQNMAGRMPLGPNTMDYYYLMGQAYEFLKHHMYALAIYQQLATMNYHYKDVAMRMNNMAQEVQKEQRAQGGDWNRPGGTIGQRYKIVQELGRGGMGVVYLAEDMHLGRKVAFKVLAEELKADTSMVQNFIREATSLAQLSHPYIISIFDAGEEGGTYFIIMEFVEGKDFKELMGKEKKRLPLSAGTLVFSQLSQALDYAHGLKIIHRDIKPANIMWTKNQTIKVMDFGLAKVMNQMREGKTQIAGTPYYMSPEQTMGRAVDARSDIYSMGVSIYELLTGTVPFKEGDVGYHHVHTPPTPPTKLNNQIPPEIEKIILKCMAKDPKSRYQTAAQVYDELTRLNIAGRS